MTNLLTGHEDYIVIREDGGEWHEPLHDQFYRWARELSKHHFVLISEYQMPSDFLSIWTKKRKVMQKSDRASAEWLENIMKSTW